MKKQIDPPIEAHILPSALILLSLVAICAIPFGLTQSHGRGINNRSEANRTDQSQVSTRNINSSQQIIATLQPSAATHETRAGLQELIEFPSANEVTRRIETLSSVLPTRGSFIATWRSASRAKGYFLDVSTSNSFSSYVDGYRSLDVGNVNGRGVTGLNPGTTYYYRVRPYTAAGLGGYSNVTTATTQPATGLIIQPTFDSSIIGNPNAAAIEAMINRAIGIYESLFSDPITIYILFRYSDTPPSPEASPSPFPPSVLSTSLSTIYTVSWNAFISALRADATTSNDHTAIASLPGSPLSTNIAPSSANGRAVGLNNTPPAMFADGTIGQGGPFDGIVTLNSAQPFSFSRPLFSGTFDAERAVEHEIDEVMGFGSYLNRNAPACPSFEAESTCPPPQAGEPCTIIAGGAVIQSCPNCSGGFDVGYVGNNSGTLQFNNIFANASGRLNVKIWYANGDATARNALLSVNGGPGTSLTFPSTGSFQTVGSIQVTLTNLIPGNSNTLLFYNPIIGHWAPDFDRIELKCTIPPPASIRPQDLFSWASPGVRNLTSDGSRYFSIDSGATNIVNFNQTPPGDFGDWLSEPCPQHPPFVQNAFACSDQFSDISATSPEGINLDVIGYDLFGHPAFFVGETALGGGWYYLQFANGIPFGYYSYLSDQNFIYHIDLGFEYLFDANDANHGIFFYDFASSHFFYTSPSTFPFLYDFSLNAWLYYLPDANNPGRYSHNPRWFFDFATGHWINL